MDGRTFLVDTGSVLFAAPLPQPGRVPLAVLQLTVLEQFWPTNNRRIE
jgi:hypothetical protein